MTFTKKKADLTPIVDNVFSIVNLAKQAKSQRPEETIDATIGSLFDEESQLVAYDSVYQYYDALSPRIKAAYASSFRGNEAFRNAAYNWVVQGQDLALSHSVIATPGGSGAVNLGITTFLDDGETVILPDIAWGPYTLMAHENQLEFKKYQMFDGDAFNLNSLKTVVNEVKQTQDRIVIVLNDPCHNPTGYSLSKEEWKDLIDFVNETSKTHPVIIIDDIAYIDYAYNLERSRDYMQTWNEISDQVLICVAFSCSKTMTAYGLRCGAAIVLAKKEESSREAEIIMEKMARATWSSVANAAMETFVYITGEGKEAFLEEKQKAIDVLKARADLFLKQAEEVDLPIYPYKEGFFITLKMDSNEARDALHEKLLKEDIYTIKVFNGIRVAVCSMPIEKVDGLAKRIKALF